MGNINKEIYAQMKEEFNGCPLFIDREKGNLDDLVGENLKITSFYELTGENGIYYAIAFEGHDDAFYLSGGALTNLISKYGDAAKQVEIQVLEKVKTNSRRDYRPIRIL